MTRRREYSLPSKVLGGTAFTFTSTDFPLTHGFLPKQDYMLTTGHLRLCEAAFSSHVSGILLTIDVKDKSDPASRIFDDEGPFSTNHHTDSVKLDEYDRFALVLLSQEHAAKYPMPMIEASMRFCWPAWLVDPITKLFKDRLLSWHPKDDRWGTDSDNPNRLLHPNQMSRYAEGRPRHTGWENFTTTLKDFIYRNEPIQFCLPAFPCKSTNPRKTSGPNPDGAEIEALLNIHQFCLALHDIYTPGADFVIVSDGHVFSDCIGIDDGDVYKYTKAVEAISEKIHADLHTERIEEQEAPSSSSSFSSSSDDRDERRLRKSPVRFISLRDIFHPLGLDPLEQVSEVDWNSYDISRPLNTTKIDPEDDKNRKMMMRACGFDPDMLDKMMEDNPGCSLTSTFRGFKRFMEHDLEALEDYKNLSQAQRKKTAYDVAKTMIHRNQAYSHLVELFLPRAIRLSIHQHNNQGPKFAINLLPKERFRKIEILKPDVLQLTTKIDQAEQSKVEEAHIPTPWHNVLVKVGSDETVYICEAGVVKDELADPQSPYDPNTSGWNEESGRYVLRYR